MPPVTVLVLKPLTHRGRSHVRGESIRVSAVDAVRFAQAGQVSLTVGATVDPAPSPEPAPVGASKRTYRRRDMVAESPTTPATEDRWDLSTEGDQ